MKNEIAEQFQMLNGHIASAISQKDYTTAAPSASTGGAREPSAGATIFFGRA